jgi:signal transduction histidine kinase
MQSVNAGFLPDFGKIGRLLGRLRTQGFWLGGGSKGFAPGSRRNRELRTALERAERASAAKTRFLADISHELRTPLNSVHGYCQLLLTGDAGAKSRDYLEAIERGTTILMRLVDDLVDMARIEAGHLTVTPAPLAIGDLVQEVCLTCREQAERRSIGLEWPDEPESLPPVVADDLRLQQVLSNLVSNAIKYNHPGGSVRVSIQTRGRDWVRIAVADTGPGISPALQARLFEPFNRLGAESTAVPGTGLGLTLSRNLTELMGGRLDFVSKPGQGSTFWIELPAAKTLVRPEPCAGIR